jgi:RHS repeat-associated protein
MSETRSLVSFGPIANLAESAGNQASIFSFLQIRRTPIAPRPASMLGLQVVQGGLGTNQVNYLYNGLGQRVSKQGPTALVPTGTHLYTFDEAGHLIGEYDFTATPRVRQETVYLGDTPVAVLTQTVAGSPAVFTTAVNYVYTDHIDTPRVITQASDNRMRWRWDQADPFGTSAPNQNPASIGAFTYNPRFPGQFYDVESNLHYNYFRDYDPRIGRYTQSDPIGLAGGINTYGYVGGNPVNYVDPTGEVAVA